MSEKKTNKAPKKGKKTVAKAAKKTAAKKVTVKKVTAEKQPLSVKGKILKLLRMRRVFRDLKTIYAKVGAKTAIQKAGVRGVLNKDIKDHGISSTFERNGENRGEYRFRGVKKVESKAA